MTDFNATSGIDNIPGTSASDRVIFDMFNDANFGDVFNGGLGVDDITITSGSIDLTPVSTFFLGFSRWGLTPA